MHGLRGIEHFAVYLIFITGGIMRTDVFIGFWDVVIFLGVFQGLFISWLSTSGGILFLPCPSG